MAPGTNGDLTDRIATIREIGDTANHVQHVLATLPKTIKHLGAKGAARRLARAAERIVATAPALADVENGFSSLNSRCPVPTLISGMEWPSQLTTACAVAYHLAFQITVLGCAEVTDLSVMLNPDDSTNSNYRIDVDELSDFLVTRFVRDGIPNELSNPQQETLRVLTNLAEKEVEIAIGALGVAPVGPGGEDIHTRNRDRDHYAYELAVRGLVWKEIYKDVNRKFPHQQLKNVRAIRAAVNAHAKRWGLPTIPPRKRGRPRNLK